MCSDSTSTSSSSRRRPSGTGPRYRTIGFSVPTVDTQPVQRDVRPRRQRQTPSTRSSPAADCAFSDGVRFRVCVPASIAGSNAGSASFERRGRGRHRACRTSSDRPGTAAGPSATRVDTASSVDGDFAIVACKRVGIPEIASNVVAISVNSSRVDLRHRRDRPHEPFERVEEPRQTRARIRQVLRDRLANAPSSGGRLAIVSFKAEPRAVSASPTPTRFSWIARRGSWRSNVWKMSSNCTGTCVCEAAASAVGDHLVRRARVQVHVLGAEHRRAADRRARVDRDLAVRLVEVQRQLRAGLAVGERDRLHRRRSRRSGSRPRARRCRRPGSSRWRCRPSAPSSARTAARVLAL